MRTRKARPERFRISFRDEAGGTPLPLRSRRMWPVGLFLGVAFLIFGGIAWSQISSMRGHEIKSVFDLTFILFQGFWVLGWSVGVVILGALTVLFLFYEESARLRDGHLIHTPRLGPLRISVEYQLAKIRNLRLERAGGHAGQGVQIRFDYGGGSNSLGNVNAPARGRNVDCADLGSDLSRSQRRGRGNRVAARSSALFVSHGVSFFTNYLGRREYLGMDLKAQMSEPYKRIIVMHVTLIIGGFLTMLLRSPEAVLLLLIALKTAADLRAHRKEHAR